MIQINRKINLLIFLKCFFTTDYLIADPVVVKYLIVKELFADLSIDIHKIYIRYTLANQTHVYLSVLKGRDV